MSFIQLGTCGSADEMIDRLSDHAATADPDEWIIAHGARPESWDPPLWPEIEEIDRAVGDRPALAWCFDYHALVGSTAALAAVDLEDLGGSGLVALDASGKPTGLVLEDAALRVWNTVPEPSATERRIQVRAACEHLRRLGYAQVHDLKSQPWLGPLLAELDSAGELGLEVVLHPLLDEAHELMGTADLWRRDRLSLGGAKLFSDGTLNSRTAWVLEPFREPIPQHPCGTPMQTPDELDQAVRRADSMGLPLAVHAIGDGAVRGVLDAIERVAPRAPGYRIEHCELIDAVDVPRFADLGVIASVQPCHLLTDIEALRRHLPHRLDRVLPLRELIDAGCTPGELLRFGSDVPIVRADPEDSIRAAVHRRRADMSESDAIAPEQAISEDEAWACFAPTS